MTLPLTNQPRLDELRQRAHTERCDPAFVNLVETADALDRTWCEAHAHRLGCWHAYQQALADEHSVLAELTAVLNRLSTVPGGGPPGALQRVAPPPSPPTHPDPAAPRTARCDPGHPSPGSQRTTRATAPESDEPLLTVHLLGAFRLARLGQPVTAWAGTKAPRVVRYLFVHVGRPIAREELLEIFWPDCDPLNARRALHQTIYQIRKALRASGDRADRISFRHEIYRLEDSDQIWSDLVEFEHAANAGKAAAVAGKRDTAVAQLTTAERLYTGAFLEDSVGEEWTHLERERLRLLYADAGNRLAGLLYERHQTEHALDVAQRVLRHDPCDESAHRRAMLCYARLGQRSSLVRQFRQCADTLKRELGLLPDRSTVNLLHTEVGEQPQTG